ncbi:MAG: hypothetical protein A3D92_21515 [Bacteroidetes bacterium RIFCSPHIGHO2_02_FULL_44_7]|nr:MAG: hypothetical protein A3D92_21515 [Bacteroidetes bacterium RIFCSPHIGHO2_02_FULL_44_7]
MNQFQYNLKPTTLGPLHNGFQLCSRPKKPFATSAVSASLAAPRLHKQSFLYFEATDKVREKR